MSDCLTQINVNATQPLKTSLISTSMETQQSPQQVSSLVTTGDHNSTAEPSANSAVNVSLSATIISSNASETHNSMTSTPNLTMSSSPMPSSVTVSTQGSIQAVSTQSQQQMVSSSQPQLVASTQSAHMSATNALMAQSLGATITSVANQTVQMAAQQPQHHNQMQPLLQTSVQQSAANQMSVAMSSLPQVQVIQQPIGAPAGTYQFQQVYPQQMLLPGNLTIQNMSAFGATNQGLSLQIPFTGSGSLNTHTMPITSIAAKPPIMSKGVAISPLPQSHQMIQQLKPNMGPPGTQQILKQVLPAQQFIPHSSANQTVVISQLLPQQNQHQIQQSILPANANKTIIEGPKGKPFMLSHSGAIQPKSPILPATATSISSTLMANPQFKSPFSANPNTAQLITTQTPSGLLTNPQILGSFQTLPPGLTWATSPQSTHLVAPNGSPIFIRGPTQGTEHMFISTSNMSSPHIQTVSMAPPMMHNTTAHMPVNTAHMAAPTQMTPTLQQITTTTIMNTTPTTSVVTTSQPPAIAPAPTPPSATKMRNIRQASIATQTAAPVVAQKQHPESSTPLKPIAAKPKSSPQSVPQNTKPIGKDSNTTTMRSTGVGSTQTISQPTLQSNKSDASNQTTRVSVATETSKTNSQSQVSSSRHTSDHNNKPLKSNSSTNTSSESSQTKVNSIANEVKTPTKRAVVEKKDASTGGDSDVMNNLYAQHNHKSVQNSIQTTNNVSNNPPQKAIKPQILTHVIDGYIIQESPNPFPVNGLSYSGDQKCLTDEKNNTIIPIESIKAKTKNENSLTASSLPSMSSRKSTADRHLCLFCGQKRKSNSKNNRNFKRFCSQSCSEKFNSNNERNSSSSPRLALYNSVTAHLEGTDPQISHESGVELSANDTNDKQTVDERKKKTLKRSHDSTNDLNSTRNGDLNDSMDRNHRKSTLNTSLDTPSVNVIPNVAVVTPDDSNSSATSATAGLYIPPGGRNPLQWSVNDVYEFVRNLQGCTEYADDFRSQEIDGQALMLIKEDHLMNTMSMKLGPALKICSKINALRDDVQKQS